jgi:hypothetical protein
MENSDPAQSTPPSPAPLEPSVGQILKAARVKKAQTLEMVSQQTRIPKKLLENLEAGQFSAFPAVAYLRGFLKNYCDALDLEFEPLWAEVLKVTAPAAGGSETKTDSDSASHPKTEHKAPSAHSNSHAHAEPEDEVEEPENFEPPAPPSPTGLVVLSCFLVLVGVIYVAAHRAAADLRTIVPPAGVQSLNGALSATLSMDLGDESWLSVWADGKPLFDATAPKNSHMTWKASKYFVVRTSNPAGLTLKLNDLPYSLSAPDAAGAYRIEVP